jgi:hypothetical protein
LNETLPWDETIGNSMKEREEWLHESFYSEITGMIFE